MARKRKAAEQESSAQSKPDKFVKLIQGTQFEDPETKQLYLLNQLTPVERITDWVRKQAEVGLFEIME